MTAASDYLEEQFLNHLTDNGTWTKPSTLYVALLTGSANDDGSGVNANELTGGGYTRLAAAFDPPSNGVSVNSAELTFSNLQPNGAPITHVAIFDAVSGGNLLLHGPLLEPRSVPNGEAAFFAPGDLTLSLD